VIITEEFLQAMSERLKVFFKKWTRKLIGGRGSTAISNTDLPKTEKIQTKKERSGLPRKQRAKNRGSGVMGLRTTDKRAARKSTEEAVGQVKNWQRPRTTTRGKGWITASASLNEGFIDRKKKEKGSRYSKFMGGILIYPSIRRERGNRESNKNERVGNRGSNGSSSAASKRGEGNSTANRERRTESKGGLGTEFRTCVKARKGWGGEKESDS